LYKNDYLNNNGLLIKDFHKIVTNNSCISVIFNKNYTKFILLEEYRPALEGVFFTLPGGGIDINETPESCISRELQEEMGLGCTNNHLIGRTINNGSYHFGEDYIFVTVCDDLETRSINLNYDEGITGYRLISWDEFYLKYWSLIRISGVLSAIFLAKIYIDNLNEKKF
jgi:8-oxo-dGTP pyrophosphatase MutT (NUDIX family)